MVLPQVIAGHFGAVEHRPEMVDIRGKNQLPGLRGCDKWQQEE